ncbi:NUDIX domain-containing protein [Panacibacter sp. DH6]|uniref:NUDIX domain-containing protein n=1 Tax=Panacibacter microcysteis TaxID=2793269 RepID=A0A931GZE0_9BACT|nr:NUDIX domain-containing protein [Panacibacter microcysteis]MBG9378167.1 NUDIX domain-containing protein [Panacibacter microcysteis]
MKHTQSAGILLYVTKPVFKVMLVHPGGPFWKNKDAASWSLPKGEFSENEEPLAAALRELKEETGIAVNAKNVIALTPVKQKSGKIIHAWALAHDAEVTTIQSNFFEMEWPPKSGKMQSFPEVDKVAWFTVEQAKEKIIPAQFALVTELQQQLSAT